MGEVGPRGFRGLNGSNGWALTALTARLGFVAVPAMRLTRSREVRGSVARYAGCRVLLPALADEGAPFRAGRGSCRWEPGGDIGCYRGLTGGSAST